MWALNPPSQNSPGAAPSRARTAMLRAASPSPTTMRAGCCPDAAESVMAVFSWLCCCLSEQARSVNGRRYRPDTGLGGIAEHSAALYVRRDQNASHLMVFARRDASLLARWAVFLQTIAFVHNLGEPP